MQEELATGHYGSEDEVLLDAMKSLRDREERFQQWRTEIQERMESLDRGEGIELEDERALREFGEQIKAEGRRSPPQVSASR